MRTNSNPPRDEMEDEVDVLGGLQRLVQGDDVARA